MAKILASVSCNLDENLVMALYPLFEAGRIEAIEWSFDTLYQFESIPKWFTELLQTYSDANRLIGHGVYFSLFSGRWSAEQQQWLAGLEKITNEFRFDHITEHFGFMTGENFHQGAPVSIPYTATTLAIGIDRLQRISNACKCTVGLENLAFSYSAEEVKKHGAFLDQLLTPVNGFIILDLHNVYCQLHNFDISAEELLKLYPLDKVREIHISGGSWEDSQVAPGRQIRRDTHDDSVPEIVFELLEKVIPMCMNLQYVVLEQLSAGLPSIESRTAFHQDFTRMAVIIQAANLIPRQSALNTFLPASIQINTQPVEDPFLFAQQSELSNILETAVSYEHAQYLLKRSLLADSAWDTEKWAPYMLETAIAIAQKWKHGFT